MANAITTCRTNWFAVKNESIFEKLIDHLRTGESTLCHQVDTDGRHFLGAYDSFDYIPYPSETQKVIDHMNQKRPIVDADGNSVSYNNIDGYNQLYDTTGEPIYDEDDIDFDFDMFLKHLQEILPDGEHFELFTSGHEKLREVYGDAIFMTNKVCEWTSLGSWMSEMCKQHCP